MKQHVIALLLSITLAATGVVIMPVFAAASTAETAIAEQVEVSEENESGKTGQTADEEKEITSTLGNTKEGSEPIDPLPSNDNKNEEDDTHGWLEKAVDLVNGSKYLNALAIICTIFGVGIITGLTGLWKKVFPPKTTSTGEQKSDSTDNTNDTDKPNYRLSATIPDAINLIGRDNDVGAIKDLLDQHPIVSILADGGVGKTAVAARVMEDIRSNRSKSSFKHVAWIRSTGNLKNDLSALDIPGIKDASSIDDKFKMACTYLENNPTFLVIDNMDSPLCVEDTNYLSNIVFNNTKILITTRIEIRNTQPFLLKTMDKQDANSLFYRHYLNNTSKKAGNSRGEEIYVEKIVDAASCNALLIELISKMAFWEYTNKLEELWEKLEKDVFGTDSEIDIETDHADSRNAGNLSEGDLKLQGQIRNLYQISSLDNTKQELMRFIAAFPAETMIFADAFKWAGFKVADLKYLTDRGWIEKSGEGYLIHSIVKGSVELQKKDFDIEKYENLINELCDTDQYLSITIGYIKVAERIVVPKRLCTLLVEKDSQKKNTARLFNNIATVCHTQSDYEKALEYFKKAIEIREKVLGLKHPDTATTYNNIALVYKVQGDYEKSLAYYKKALGIREKVLSPEHPDTATTYNDIAGLYYAQGNYEKALEYDKKALEIREKVLGLEHPDTATTYNNMALVYLAQNDYEKALEYDKKALEIREKVLGLEHPDTAVTYNNMALVYKAQDDYEKALKYYKKALEIEEKVFGVEHPDTATMYNNVAKVYYDQCDFAKALEYNKKALGIREKVLGPEHQDTATTYNDIAVLYYALGNYAKALEYDKKVLEIEEKVLGLESPDTAVTYNNMALVYHAQCDFAKALEYYKKALEIKEKVFGVEHPSTAMTYNNIAGVYHAQGDFAKALEYYKKALEINEKVFGVEHSDTATIYNNMAGVYDAQGDYAMALEYYEKTLDIREKVLEMEHPFTSNTYNNMARVYMTQGDYEKALEYYMKALNIREKVFGLEHPSTAEMYNNIGLLYYYLEDNDQAKKYLQIAYDVRLKVLGKEHPDTRSTKESIEKVIKRMKNQ